MAGALSVCLVVFLIRTTNTYIRELSFVTFFCCCCCISSKSKYDYPRRPSSALRFFYWHIRIKLWESNVLFDLSSKVITNGRFLKLIEKKNCLENSIITETNIIFHYLWILLPSPNHPSPPPPFGMIDSVTFSSKWAHDDDDI